MFRNNVESNQSEVQKKVSEMREKFIEAQKQFEFHKRERDEAVSTLDSKNSENDNLSIEIENQTRRMVQIENEIQSVKSKEKSIEKERSQLLTSKTETELQEEKLREEIQNLDKDLDERQARLKHIPCMYVTVFTKLMLYFVYFRYDEIKNGYEERRQELDLFYEQRGRKALFTSTQEREKWLNENITEWKKSLDAKKTQLHKSQTKITSLEKDQANLRNEIGR